MILPRLDEQSSRISIRKLNCSLRALCHWLPAFENRIIKLRRELHSSGAIGGNYNLQREGVAGDFPTAGDGAADRVVGRPGPGDITDGGWLDENLFESNIRWIGLDAGETAVEPFHDVSEHEVILR